MNQISQRDFFAAHAPVEIPEWFKVKANPAPTRPTAKEFTNDRLLAEYLDGWAKDPEFSPLDILNASEFSKREDRRELGQKVVLFQTAVENYYHAKQQHTEHQKSARYFAWRWAYADGMIAAEGGAK